MNDKQNAKQNMYQVVLHTLQENGSLYKEFPLFVKAVTELETAVKDIGIAAEQQSKTTLQGATLAKNIAETTLVNECVKVANVLSVLARDLGDTTLLSRVILTKSQMYQAPDNETLRIAWRLLAEASAHEPALLEYGITAPNIQMLHNAAKGFEQWLVAPRASMVASKQSTASLVHLFAYADTLLYDRLDKLIGIFKDAAPDFYAQYFYARNIINSSARKHKSTEATEGV
jgi:hypothetical protein